MVSIDKARIAQNTVAHLPFFSTICVMPFCKPFVLMVFHVMGVEVILLTRSRKIADSGPAERAIRENRSVESRVLRREGNADLDRMRGAVERGWRKCQAVFVTDELCSAECFPGSRESGSGAVR